ncbi:methyl-accepting chemotaxis protein [Vibrio algarum]|uniref:Methyl-accepting chemotaxis protein n=1 Tax=Vibrio algarum TaxID=3020714 RepID=A0ABT4YVG2_9VIBR|nr:methyl-accepting chemotaxis protein [Vibrio sp. KJ40-1]MDB1125440.1 methyl-accepting chemotaxis protein [Vibrio sp. KJ40-1]
MKFSHKIVAASALLMLVTVSIVTTKQVFNTQDLLTDTIVHGLNNAMDSVKSNVAEQISGQKALAVYTTEMASDDLNPTAIEKVIRKPSLKKPFLLVGGGLETDGKAISGDVTWDPGPQWDARVRPWYEDAKSKNDLIVTAPYEDAVTKEILISIATPLKQGGKFVGSLFFDVSLASLAETINQVNLFDAGYLFIVSSDGTIIAHPDTELNGKPFTQMQSQVSISEKLQLVNSNGTELAYDFRKIPGINWYVGTVIDNGIAFQPVNDMRTSSIIATAVALIISIGLLLLLIGKLMKPLGTLNHAIQDVATGDGNLTQRLATDTDAEFAELAQGFNTFTESLQDKIKHLKGISQEILNGAEASSEGAIGAAAAMTEQMREIEQLATAMHEMATTSTDMAGNAQGAASAAQEADNATLEGSAIVNNTTQSIGELSASIDDAVTQVKSLEDATDSIETVLQVINDIADQTNLLALNAAIEAARAGEYGRGFAVVADEVRTLAQRTQESTTEIRTMIEQLQAGAGAVAKAMGASKDTAVITVTQAEEANGALERIRDSIQRITDMNMQIASAAEEQSLVAEEINSNTVKIKDLSEMVAGAAGESSTLMQVQADNVREQNGILDKFVV